MKTLQLIFGALLLSLVFGSSVFAQDAMRADEYRNHPESFRIGDSNDLQADQMRADEMRVCENHRERIEGVQKEQFKKFIHDRHFNRGSDYI
nr:hypothetical protein BHI3_25270 [Bacteriovorax sp. HI3]